ncbi:MAG: transporter [Desulfobacteraceae bacterium 4572_35.1]|nr:MAG: transporter [Desulfobacteraceae bacterium 4572_35.1]
MLADLQFAFMVTAPVFCVLLAGVVLRRINLITDHFARVGANLVFRVTLPCLLFVKLSQADFTHNLPVALICYAMVSTLVVFVFLDIIIAPRLSNTEKRGVFVQGAFRGNMGIIGLAFCISAFGEDAIAKASIYLAFMTTLYNILAVITLSRHNQSADADVDVKKLLWGIIKNPLILAIVAGAIVSITALPVPEVAMKTGIYFAQMTLPLALLCAGATIRLREFYSSPELYGALLCKLVLVPLIVTGGAIAVGLRSESLGILYLMSSAPTAAASYPMTIALGGDKYLSAAIIAATLSGSLLSTTVGIFVLKFFQFI